MKTNDELQSENERLAEENKQLRLMEANYSLWYKIADRTVTEIYNKHLELQSQMYEICTRIKQIPDEVLRKTK